MIVQTIPVIKTCEIVQHTLGGQPTKETCGGYKHKMLKDNDFAKRQSVDQYTFKTYRGFMEQPNPDISSLST